MKVCFYCGKDIDPAEYRIVPLDIPYVNLPAHRTCADAMDEDYLRENAARIYAFVEQQNNSVFKKTKRKEEK
jgi:hypothetical protein